MIVGLVSTFREGPLAVSAVRSLLPACDMILVYEGSVDGADPAAGEPTDWSGAVDIRKDPRVVVSFRRFIDETSKRRAMLEWAKRLPAPVWGLTLDADELLIHGELIRDLVWSVEHHNPDGGEHIGIGLRLVEWDGSVSYVKNRLLRLDRIVANVYTWSQFRTVGSDEITALGNEPIWFPHAEFAADDAGVAHCHQTPFNRPPLQGEPHILHRSLLRPPDRSRFRLHELEQAGLDRSPLLEGVPGVDRQ